MAVGLHREGGVVRGWCPQRHEPPSGPGAGMRKRVVEQEGFTLAELVIVMAIIAVLAAIAFPSIFITDETRARQAIREVEREFQTARFKAVTTNRPIQVRLNCPGTGMYRMVEAGSIWPDAGRCSQSAYPFPPLADAAYQLPPMPRYDGPIRYLDPSIGLSPGNPSLVIQFMPDGRTATVVAGVAQLINTVQVDVTCRTKTKTVEINGLGRIQVQ